jgi:hypothetical protein
MKKAISGARTSSIQLFSSIVRENHKKLASLNLRAKKTAEELTKATGEDNKIALEKEINSTEAEIAKSALVVIVFSAMAIEAYIYDYAARHLGDAFVKDHLDKLDILSKWIIIPELITGKEVSRHQKWYLLLKNLIKTRNSVIHHKSSEPPASPSDVEKYLHKLKEADSSIYETARQSITLLGILADKIIEIDPEETPWVKSYLA